MRKIICTMSISIVLCGSAFAFAQKPHSPHLPMNNSASEEHCVTYNEYPPPRYDKRFPKGIKKMQNACPYKIFVIWCYAAKAVSNGPSQKGQCGYKGTLKQYSAYFSAGRENFAPIDIYENVYITTCKDGPSNFVYKNGKNINNGYGCK